MAYEVWADDEVLGSELSRQLFHAVQIFSCLQTIKTINF